MLIVNIEAQLKELDTCEYQEQKFADILYEIQKAIDYLNLKGFSNLPQCVAKLDEEVEKKFAGRLNAAIRVWVDILSDRKRRQDDDDSVIRRRGKDEKRVEPAFQALFDEFLVGFGSLEMGDSLIETQEKFIRVVYV